MIAIFLAACTVYSGAPISTKVAPRSITGLRIASWNIDSIGTGDELEQTTAALSRIDADVVALVGLISLEDNNNLTLLADSLGYEYTAVASISSDSEHHAAVLSRFALSEISSLNGADISGDSRSTDTIRDVLSVEIATESGPITLLSAHLKGSTTDSDEFRRVVEATRVAQAVGEVEDRRVIVLGSWGINTLAAPFSPSTFEGFPEEIPDGYWLGQDLYSQMRSTGLVNDPFAPLTNKGLIHLNNHPGRYDQVFVSTAFDEVVLESYPDPSTTLSYDGEVQSDAELDLASPSRPMVLEIDRVPAEEATLALADVPAGGLIVSEIMANPECSEPQGEWFELYNPGSAPIDLKGLVITDNSSNKATIEESLVVAAQQRVVIAHTGSGDCGPVGDLQVELPSLNNGGDLITLSFEGSIINESLHWISTVEGLSKQLGASAWCEQSPTPGLGDQCGEGDPTPTEPTEETGGGTDCSADLDSDGYNACEDCDDLNSAVHPGATEQCNGIDDDCSGGVDRIELDTDGDGSMDCRDCDEAGWWESTRSLSGYSLSDKVGDLVSAQTCYSYNNSRKDIFLDVYKESGQVECVYTGRKTTVGGVLPDNSDMNTEHTWPKSLGASTYPAKCDLHHLFPSDSWTNSVRSSLPFCVVVDENPWKAVEGGSLVGWNAQGEECFEPRDSHKGNVARAMLYFASRYDYYLSYDEVDLYKEWAQADPVDADELRRTWEISRIQRLPNPYVVCRDLAENR